MNRGKGAVLILDPSLSHDDEKGEQDYYLDSIYSSMLDREVYVTSDESTALNRMRNGECITTLVFEPAMFWEKESREMTDFLKEVDRIGVAKVVQSFLDQERMDSYFCLNKGKDYDAYTYKCGTFGGMRILKGIIESLEKF